MRSQTTPPVGSELSRRRLLEVTGKGAGTALVAGSAPVLLRHAKAAETLVLWHQDGRELAIEQQNAWVARAAEPLGIEVTSEVFPPGEIDRKVVAAKATDTLPDIAASFNQGMWIWAWQGIASPVDDVMSAIGADNFPDALVRQSTLDGQAYGIPLHYSPYLSAYRADWFQEQGLNEPTTWDEIIASGEAVTAPPDRYGFGAFLKDPNNQWIYNLMAVSDAYLFDQDGNLAIDRPEMVEALQLGKTLAADLSPPGVSSIDGSQVRFDFLKGLTAQMYASSSLAGLVMTDAPDLSSSIGAMRTPSLNGTASGINNMNWLCVTTGTEKREAVTELLKALYEPENFLQWISGTMVGLMPVLKSAEESYLASERLQPVSHILAAAVEGVEDTWLGPAKYGAHPGIAAIAGRGIETNMMQMVVDGSPPEEAISWAETEITRLVERAN